MAGDDGLDLLPKGTLVLIARDLLAITKELKETTEPRPIDMARELRETLGMFSGAMSCTPKEAWEEALAVVADLRKGRCAECHEKITGQPPEHLR